jgi:hypothetical protein
MRKKYFTEEARSEAKKAYDKMYRKSTKDARDAYRQERRATRSGYIDRFLERAKVKTPDTDLDRGYLENIMGDGCAISGMPFQYVNPEDCYHNAFAPSIDRIDSTRGYYRNNVQIILACVNRMKNDMPNDAFLKLWKALVEE